MAHRSRRRVNALLAGLAIAAAACGSTVEVTTTAQQIPTTVMTPEPTTTVATSTSRPGPTTTEAMSTTTSAPPGIDAEVSIPSGEGPFPAVVLVHGGGWILGTPRLMAPLAEHLTRAGYLTVNTAYRLSTTDYAGFPAAVDDVACAVRFAAGHPRSDGTVTVVGHSAGAHLAAIVALTGDRYGAGCAFAGSGVPDRLVGLGGPYDIDRLGAAMVVFFGSGPSDDPDAWMAGNPQRLADSNPGLTALIVHGELDGIVDISFAVDFHDALTSAGVASSLEVVDGAGHNDLTDPGLVGDLITAWLALVTSP